MIKAAAAKGLQESAADWLFIIKTETSPKPASTIPIESRKDQQRDQLLLKVETEQTSTTQSKKNGRKQRSSINAQSSSSNNSRRASRASESHRTSQHLAGDNLQGNSNRIFKAVKNLIYSGISFLVSRSNTRKSIFQLAGAVMVLSFFLTYWLNAKLGRLIILDNDSQYHRLPSIGSAFRFDHQQIAPVCYKMWNSGAVDWINEFSILDHESFEQR